MILLGAVPVSAGACSSHSPLLGDAQPTRRMEGFGDRSAVGGAAGGRASTAAKRKI
jgi:hypothetical protein